MLDLKFCLLNAENLFLLFDQPIPKNYLKLEEAQWQKLSGSIYENKQLFKVIHLAQTLKQINADIVMLCEVGGLESLKNFNTYFLDEAYSPILIEGNSDRNIDVGFLVKKNSAFYFDLLTHKNRELNFLYPHERLSKETNHPPKITSHKLSRDCAELRLFTRDMNKPFLVALLTHLKSPLDPDRIDPGGAERRGAELKTCVAIYNELKNQLSCPVILCGDFNGNASRTLTDSEFLPLLQETDLQDIFERVGLEPEKRSTFIQVKSGLRSEGRQIDFCFLPDSLQGNVKKDSAHVWVYKDEFGSALKRPDTLEQKAALPSDHYPVVFTLEKLQI